MEAPTALEMALVAGRRIAAVVLLRLLLLLLVVLVLVVALCVRLWKGAFVIVGV